jgi:hypothetical protein
MNFAWSYWNVAYPAAILWGGIIWPCGAFEGRQTIYVPSSVLEGPAVRSLSKEKKIVSYYYLNKLYMIGNLNIV